MEWKCRYHNGQSSLYDSQGGIIHNKFSIKTSRAEPLFVDYIIEHLNTNGRGAIIIPEGVTSNKNAFYSELRKS